MSEESVATKVEGVYKNFHLPHLRNNSVKSLFTNVFSKKGRSVETQHALKNISFEVKKGEFFGIVGRNGSGKSTLLKILAEIYQPTRGKVSIHGKLVPFIELGVGFNPELSGRENVYLNGALLGLTKKQIDKQYKDIVEFAELEDFMDQKLKNYSSGMQVRLAFSVATRSKADILLIDEVLAVGDAEFQRKCFNYFKQLKRLHTTVVFVTHDMEAIREYCDRAMLIENSEIKEIGSTQTVASAYTQLFTETTQAKEESERWGTGKIIVSEVKTSLDSKQLNVRFMLQPEEAIADPIFGFRIRSQDGREITGTNTKIEGVKLGKLQKGKMQEVVLSLPNILSDGTYFIDPALLDADGITVHDWWNNAVQLEVHKERRLPYSIDPGFKLEIKE
jgi:ABC-2 type transport system ATP-binding protein